MKLSPFGAIIKKFTEGKERFDTNIKGLSFHRAQAPTKPVSYTLSPHLCLIAQGRKRVMLGEEEYSYNKDSFMLSSIDLPVVSQIIEASEKRPYLGMTLELDLNELSQFIADSNIRRIEKKQKRAIAVSDMPSPLLDAVERLVKLLDTPDDIVVMGAVVRREIYYRLLTDDQGGRLWQIVKAGSKNHNIARAINWLKDNFDRPLHIRELASSVGMSESAFHQHFRALTSMSPLQYQKRLRLNEARRLMLIEEMSAGSASFKVGYESPTQFSREYKRMFGAPPHASIKKQQATEYNAI